MRTTLILLILAAFSMLASSQSSEALLKMLLDNNLITSTQADSFRKVESAPKKSFLVETSRQMQLSGFSQIRYQMYEENTRNDGFDIRRVRLDLKGNINSRFSYRLQTEMADKPKILDAYAEIKIAEYLVLTIGQFRIPFSLENLASVNRFEVIDFAQSVDALTSRGKDVIGNHIGRDVGIQAGGTLLKNAIGSLLEYRFGIFNGSGMNLADTANEAKDIAARIILNPVKGLSFGISYYDGWGKAVKPAPEFAGRSQERNRFGIDASYTVKDLSLKAEFIQGRDGNYDRAGWYIMAAYYVIPKKLQAVLKYDSYDPERNTANNRSVFYSGGINFNFNNWSRLQAFYTIREEEGAKIDNNLLSIQYQIGF